MNRRYCTSRTRSLGSSDPSGNDWSRRDRTGDRPATRHAGTGNSPRGDCQSDAWSTVNGHFARPESRMEASELCFAKPMLQSLAGMPVLTETPPY